MSALARALLDDLDGSALDALAERLAPRLAELFHAAQPEPDRWLDAKGASAYLGITTSALHKLSANRALPFERDGPGCKLWFRRSELDAWRRHDRGPLTGERFQDASKRNNRGVRTTTSPNKNPA